MPVRSLNSAVLRWPDRDSVLSAARRWAADILRRDAAVQRIGCIGSYARGDCGVGSDIDLVVIVRQCERSPVERHRRFDPGELPVHADLWVYTTDEWARMAARSPLLRQRLEREWVSLV